MLDGSRVLRLQTLARLGSAERIVRTHLDEAMRALPPGERDIAADIFHHLVTPSGAKIAHTAPDLAKYARLDEADLTPVLETLAGGGVRSASSSRAYFARSGAGGRGGAGSQGAGGREALQGGRGRVGRARARRRRGGGVGDRTEGRGAGGAAARGRAGDDREVA